MEGGYLRTHNTHAGLGAYIYVEYARTYQRNHALYQCKNAWRQFSAYFRLSEKLKYTIHDCGCETVLLLYCALTNHEDMDQTIFGNIFQ